MRKKKNLIKRYRQYQELSQDDLARIVGTYQVKIARYERGEVKNIPQVMKVNIAEALGLPVRVIFPDTGSEV